jgi:hypothetical protein
LLQRRFLRYALVALGAEEKGHVNQRPARRHWLDIGARLRALRQVVADPLPHALTRAGLGVDPIHELDFYTRKQ